MNKIGDVIYRQDAINAIENTECELTPAAWDEITDAINEVLSARPEPFTDKEQRIFLAAMSREEKVCKQVDDEYKEPYEDSLVSICHEIIRKVKSALWT